MMHRQYSKIDQYEIEWRKRHGIKDGEPSTLVDKKIVKKIMSVKKDTQISAQVN